MPIGRDYWPRCARQWLCIPSFAITSFHCVGRTVFSEQVYYFSNQERIMKHSCSNTLVYTFASLTVEHCVIFWNTSSGEKYAKTVKNLVFITSCKDFCLLTTKQDDGSEQVRVVWYFLLVVKLWFSNHYNLYITFTCVASQIVCGCLKGTATVYKSHMPSVVSFKPGCIHVS